MNTILIKNAFFQDKEIDVLIQGDSIKQIAPSINAKADKTIDATNHALVAPFYNMHTHAAMSLLRGFADDLVLQEWLTKHIWPREAKLTYQDIYIGTKLAIVEMIHSGTVFFLDMYWFHKAVLQAAMDMGIRCVVGLTFIDAKGEKEAQENFDFIRSFVQSSDLVTICPAPHAIYTVGKDLYQECAKVARQCGLRITTHLSETQQEVQDCKKQNNGLTPVEYLDSIGVLDSNMIAAHCVHLSENDAQILAQRKVVIAHNPASNMKLASGVFNVPLLNKYGATITLGTDGASSNNNLSMLEEMKLAALVAKHNFSNPQILPAQEIYSWATENGAKAMNINAGVIAEGKKADLMLVNLLNERMVPNTNTISNLVYSADSRCIDTLICNGNILMENQYIPQEAQIIEQIRKLNFK